MGVDTKLYINKDWEIQDIIDVLTQQLKVKVKIEFHEWAPDYVVLNFPSRFKDETRSLSVHTNTKAAGFPAMLLSFRSNTEGCDILKMLARHFGGLYQEADTDDVFEAFDKPGEGNADFLLKEAIKKDPSMGHNFEKLSNYFKEKK